MLTRIRETLTTVSGAPAIYDRSRSIPMEQPEKMYSPRLREISKFLPFFFFSSSLSIVATFYRAFVNEIT